MNIFQKEFEYTVLQSIPMSVFFPVLGVYPSRSGVVSIVRPPQNPRSGSEVAKNNPGGTGPREGTLPRDVIHNVKYEWYNPPESWN